MVTSNGWPSHFVQDYVSQTMGFEAQLLSLMGEGVFNQFPGLRVILMSGYSDRLFATEGPWDARASFLEKPFTPNDLLERIKQTLGRG